MFKQNTNTFNPNVRKTIESLLFIINQVGDLWKALKILYFADKHHLNKYGRFIAGDTYIAMKNGAVPSLAYDVIKLSRGDGRVKFDESENIDIKQSIKVQNNDELIANRVPNLKYLSETDIECLTLSLEENKNLSKIELWIKSHENDIAYMLTETKDGNIPIEHITKSIENGDEVLEYLKNMY